MGIMEITALIRSLIAAFGAGYRVRKEMLESLPLVRARTVRVYDDVVVAYIDIFPTERHVAIWKISSNARGIALVENIGLNVTGLVDHDRHVGVHAFLPPISTPIAPLTLRVSFLLRKKQSSVDVYLYRSRGFFALPHPVHRFVVADTD